MAIAAGVCGTLFVGYCIYFDHKRHKDPEFKRKLRERRHANKQDKAVNRPSTVDFPNMKDYQAVQKFFAQEVQLSDELLAAGDVENAVDHLANAVTVCDQPNELLQVLQQTFPPNVFHLLIQRLPLIAPRVLKQERRLQEEDVE
ncbi:hypothetical protein RN001_014980 [Aquatica leii]|uniref:Uncharacterized protein n=1 Tax=Aquatica leii TaxID=1421715 RepID=A0AAN7P0D0_9COLE|nr:hypothetical protein RN001_014980 [Aquatica leii]